VLRDSGETTAERGGTGHDGTAALGAAALALGLLVAAWPAAWALWTSWEPAWAWAGAVIGAVAAGVAAAGWWRPAATVTVAAAAGQCAAGRLPAAALAAEGLFVLGYLILASAPGGMDRRLALRWLRRQAPSGIAGLVAAGAVLAVLAPRALRPPASPWFVLAGLAAAVAAYFAALPLRPRRDPARRRGPGMRVNDPPAT
jgi:hypothetical protein